jgi:hypothetical protein
VTKWFGESWGAPVCEPDNHIETPTWMLCAGHDHMHTHRSRTVQAGDQGVTIPYLGHSTEIAYHLDCWLHEIGADRL